MKRKEISTLRDTGVRVFVFDAAVQCDRKQSVPQSSVAQLPPIPLCFVSYQCDFYLSLAPDSRVFNEDLCPSFLWQGGMLIPNREERYERWESPSYGKVRYTRGLVVVYCTCLNVI